MRIEIDRLDSAGEAFSHIYGPDELSLDEERARLVTETRVSGRATKSGYEVRLRGAADTTVQVDCDRCATPVVLPLELEFDVSYVPAAQADANDNLELRKLDLDYSIYEGGEIDVDELASEQVLLALPTRQLCRENCKGLCPNCGANLNAQDCSCTVEEIDPRWADLAKLRES